LKLHLEQPTVLNTVTAYGPGFVEVNRIRYDSALLLLPSHPVSAWQVANFEALEPSSFDALVPLAPDVVLLGTGARQRFPASAVTASLRRRGIGVEVMDTAAACRTYNILMGEGRAVAAALLIDPA
jgi:uncharacterized protein